MGLTVNRQMVKKSTVNRQKRNTFIVNRQPSNERAKISRQISFLIFFKQCSLFLSSFFFKFFSNNFLLILF